MDTNDINDLNKVIYDLHKELIELGPMMRGSVTMIGTKKKQPHFSASIEGRTKLVYLGKKREGIARQYTENYKRLMEIVQEMTLTNMQLLKLQAQIEKKELKEGQSKEVRK